MEGSFLGAVRATGLLLSVHTAWEGGEAAPRDHRLHLEGNGRRMGGRGPKGEEEDNDTIRRNKKLTISV